MAVYKSLVFSSTNIRRLSQLNALASMRRLDNLTINSDGNPVTKLGVWRSYVVFRLAHFSLKHINGSEVGNRHHYHSFAQNTIKVDNGYVNEQKRKAHCALTSAHNIYVDCGTQYT